MSQLDSYGLSEYLEGSDFFVTMQKEINTQSYGTNFGITHHMHFKDTDGNLLGYIRLFVEQKDNAWKTKKETTAYIVDTISSSAYDKHFSQARQVSFLKNGYTPGVFLPGFGPTMLAYSLAYVKEHFPETYIVLVAANDRKGNIQAIWDVVGKVQDRTHNLIEGLNGGGDMYAVTIRLQQ